MTKIDEITKKRLFYVKRLYTHGHEHIPYSTEFDRMIAIHHFDNAIELFLKCVATRYEISFRDPLHVTFHNLWDKVNEKYRQEHKSELPKKTEMFQLHDFRCDVQHWGVSPVSLEITNRFDVYTVDFIERILSSVFGLKYNELFMSSLINDIEVRELLTDAEKFIADEKWKEAVHKVSIAFAVAKSKAERKLSLYTPIQTLSSLSSTFGEFREINEGITKLTEAVRVLALDIDYEEYMNFQNNTPVVFLPFEGNPIIQEIKELNYTRENAISCFNFVLDSILKWHL